MAYFDPFSNKWLLEVKFILLNFTIRVWFFPKPQLSSEKTWLFPLYFHLENVKRTDFLQMLLCCLFLHLISVLAVITWVGDGVRGGKAKVRAR